jgi:hypothetical protein
VWYEDRRFWLILVDGYAADAAYFDQEPDGALVSYPGYTIEHPIRSTQNLSVALEIGGNRPPPGRVGIETGSVTAYRAMWSPALPPGVEIRLSTTGCLLRMVKTEEELVKLRRNFTLTDAATPLFGGRCGRTAGDRRVAAVQARSTGGGLPRAAGQRLRGRLAQPQ